MKVIAMYLPQYHTIPENDEWWGKGYTEWTAVKNAMPLYKGHKEPRIPLNKNYYNLADESGAVWEWQAKIAKKYGVYGFCIYHYWFEGKQLLEKPMEILRQHPEIDINYCICWANETWTRNWYNQERTVLMEQTYGDEEAWKKHFIYLKDFFLDSRYIKINNKPVVNIYHSQEIEKLSNMLEVWNNLAKDLGFDGVYIISGITSKGEDTRENLIDAKYVFEPGFILKKRLCHVENGAYILKTGLVRVFNKINKSKHLEHKIDIRMIYKHIENDEIPDKAFPGTFPQWDNTPRTGTMGLSYINSSPELFEHNLNVLKKKYSSKEFIYINAWNEWGEGAYLEPDEEYKYEYLEALSHVMESR